MNGKAQHLTKASFPLPAGEWELRVNGSRISGFATQQSAQEYYRRLVKAGVRITSASIWYSGKFMFTIV